MTKYFEYQYCEACMFPHWIEIQNKGDLSRREKEICHGKDFFPKDSATHYTRRSGRGIELVRMYKRGRPTDATPLPLDWQIAIKTLQDIEF